jgi:hypothetical protein
MLFECAGIALSHLVLVAQLSRRTQRAAGSADHIVHDLAVTHSPSPPVTWVLISEIFPNRVRDIGSRFWPLLSGVLCLFLKTFTFPILNRVLDPAGTFWPYAGVCLAGLFLYL